VKVYWSKCGHGHGNFGDKITPLLLKHLEIPVEWSPPEHAELIGVGSILEKVPENFKGMIWTTGFMHASSRRLFSQARVLGVRGKLTLERIDCARRGDVLLGDAGLLCDELSPAACPKYKLGIIPHFVDVDDPFVKKLAARSSDVRVIDICADTSEVMRGVAECEHIISSSLHGLILADSLGIPNRWLKLNRGPEIVTGDDFKYRDYYSVFGSLPDPLHLTAATTLDEVLNSIVRLAQPGLPEIKTSLRSSLCRIKDEVRPLSANELQARHDAKADWARRLAELQRVVAEVVPRHARVIVADEEQVRGAFADLHAIPFLEREGIYWGPPGSAEQAIEETQRQSDRGATWVIIAWPMFWVLEKYPGFAFHLGERFECRFDSDIARIFELRGP
jgi:hypothetical protein